MQPTQRSGSVLRRSFVTVSIMLILALFSAVAGAGIGLFACDWRSIDAGGGSSIGGQYRLSGSAGQPDAATLTGGAFTIQGGYWPGVPPHRNATRAMWWMYDADVKSQ